MSKKSGEWGKLTIPSDWNEATDGYLLVALCIPNSFQWRGIMYGQISDLAYGRKWNRNTGTITDVQVIAGEIFETMAMTCLDDVVVALQCICTAIDTMADKTDVIEQETDAPASDGTTSVGPGEQFPDLTAYEVAKCNVANGIYDTVLGTVTWLKNNNVDLLAGVFGGVTSGLLIALALAGPAGWAVALVGTIIGSLAGYLITYAVDFEDLEAAITEQHTEAVQALFEAVNADSARSAFLTAIGDAATPITIIESELIELFLSFEMINNLFLPRSDMETYESPDPVICTAFCQEIYLSFGIELSENVFQSLVTGEGNYAIVLVVWYNGTIACGDDISKTITITDLVGWTDDTHDPGFDQSFRYASVVAGGGVGCTDWDVYCSDVEPVGGLFCRHVNVRSDTDFTMTIAVS